MNKFLLLSSAVVAGAFGVQAANVDRPTGFKVGQHMTLRPYVSLSYTFDSNPDCIRKSESRNGSSWVVNPGIGVEYKAENWQIVGNAWYQYHAYNRYSTQRNSNSFGENLGFAWANSKADEKGWTLLLNESYTKINEDDDMNQFGGRGFGRDRDEFKVNAALERRITEKLHANVHAGYYNLDYKNDSNKYWDLYGWTRTTAGGEIGYAASKWTDFLVSANYQWYDQDNTHGYGSSDSRGWSLMAGIGTRATERITYRVLGGWSRFNYSNLKGSAEVDGWTYEASGNWKMSDTWSMMALAASYYQPSEREYASSIRVDTLSWGLAHSMVRNKLTATLDVAYRREDHEYSSYYGADYTQNILTGRIGLNYVINRYLTAFARAEYQTVDTSGSYGNASGYGWEYNRFRGTVGVRLTY